MPACADIVFGGADWVIPLRVITPADTSKPRLTLHLLNGAGGGEDSALRQVNTDMAGFFADKSVNAISPGQRPVCESREVSYWEEDLHMRGRRSRRRP
ncbi:hypothetical protein [Rhodococcus marinonascens]|uniref:hypothetical protein n=1 Tax=Rhodococcus marinonascens TaxID=38311 RepID=UPI000933928A